jgi:hypothetical protein
MRAGDSSSPVGMEDVRLSGETRAVISVGVRLVGGLRCCFMLRHSTLGCAEAFISRASRVPSRVQPQCAWSLTAQHVAGDREFLTSRVSGPPANGSVARGRLSMLGFQLQWTGSVRWIQPVWRSIPCVRSTSLRLRSTTTGALGLPCHRLTVVEAVVCSLLRDDLARPRLDRCKHRGAPPSRSMRAPGGPKTVMRM